VTVEVPQHTPARVARDREPDHPLGDLDRLGPADQIGGEGRRSTVVVVDPDRGAEVLCVAVRIGDVVAVGEQHEVDAAECFDRRDQLPGPPRRIDHHVRPTADQQVGVSTERRLGVVAEAVHAVAEVVGEHARRRLADRLVAHRPGRTDQDGAPGHGDLRVRPRLPREHRHPVTGVADDQTRRDVTRGVAVDAAVIDEPGPVGAARVSHVLASHGVHSRGRRGRHGARSLRSGPARGPPPPGMSSANGAHRHPAVGCAATARGESDGTEVVDRQGRTGQRTR
jgi:hypothetical protein